MRRRVRLAALFLAALLAGLACAPAKKPPHATVIVFWECWPTELIQPLVAEFESSHPGIEVRLERLAWGEARERIRAAVAGDSVPDLCEIGSASMPGLLAAGRLADWSAGVADLRPRLRGWELCSVGDALYGVPWLLEPRALFYNPSLLARARLDPRRPPETWDELYRAAAAIQRLGHGVHGYGVPTAGNGALAAGLLSFLWANGGRVLSDDGRRATFDSAQSVAALEFVQRLCKAGVLQRQDSLERAFEEGRLGFLLSGAWLLRRIPRLAPGLRYGVALVPKPTAEDSASIAWADGEVLASFQGSRHKHEALDLARFLVQPASVLALAKGAAVGERGEVPALVGADTVADYRDRPAERMMLLQLEGARFSPRHPAWSEMESAIEDEAQQALEGRKTAAEAVRDGQARLSLLLGKR